MSNTNDPLREKLTTLEAQAKDIQSELLGKRCVEALSIIQGYIAALDAVGSCVSNEEADEVVTTAISLNTRHGNLVKSMRCLAENPHVLRDGVDIWPLYDIVMALDGATFNYDPRMTEYCPRDHNINMHMFKRVSASVARCPLCSTEVIIPPSQR